METEAATAAPVLEGEPPEDGGSPNGEVG
jgi:hypothetical protein